MKYIMKNLLSISICTMLGLTANAQPTTNIQTKTFPNGKTEVSVEYTKKNDFSIDTFKEADKNNDNCVDKKEAFDLGIRNFKLFAKVSPNCLNSEEYEKAMRSQ